jgi:isopentenyl-diphosphate delta-isomerase
MKQQVILVDRNDRRIGVEEKLKAHSHAGMLHRAISIFVFNKKGELLLQQRAKSKYHSPGKWSNTCCSHPMPAEKCLSAAHRRLVEEMGFDCRMKQAFEFEYEAEVGRGLREHEYDHVIFGFFDGEPKLNPREVANYKWIGLKELRSQIRKNPGSFSPWLRLALDKVADNYSKITRAFKFTRRSK